MTREQAFSRLLEFSLTRRLAAAMVRAAKAAGSASNGGVLVGCHPYTRHYYVRSA
jgi:hypothetical protein